MTKPIAFDICARKGGATKGLQRAGFRVFAFDIEPQPGNPADQFIQADGLEILATLVALGSVKIDGAWVRPDLLGQSWPCQDANTQTQGNRKRGIVDSHEQFIPRARELSDKIGIPYYLEQPTSSRVMTIRKDLTLCMDMFKGDMPPPWIQRHRSFELSGFTVPQPEHPDGKIAGHDGYVRGYRGRHGDVPGFYREGPYVAAHGDGGGKGKAWEIAHAMRLDWMTRPGMTKAEEKAARFDLCEAIPPDYSEYIGRAFLASR